MKGCADDLHLTIWASFHADSSEFRSFLFRSDASANDRWNRCLLKNTLPAPLHGAAFQPASPNFNPRTPWGRDNSGRISAAIHCEFQSTRPVGHDARWQGEVQVCLWISTHLPRVGQDADRLQQPPDRQMISIHLPRVGQDRCL